MPAVILIVEVDEARFYALSPCAQLLGELRYRGVQKIDMRPVVFADRVMQDFRRLERVNCDIRGSRDADADQLKSDVCVNQ